MGLFDLPEISPNSVENPTGTAAQNEAGSEKVAELAKRNAELRDELARVTENFVRYRATVEETLERRWSEEDGADAGKEKGIQKGREEDKSKYYWEGYATNDIHETMLKDKVRTDAYRDFIYNNKHLFAGKTVLDIGCGTGILSMFAARAGASRVYAVDASDIITKARANVYHAGLSSTVTLFKGRMEDVQLPSQVDIIVSEWMGYALLYEAMLPSVLYARDHYLRPDGLMVPSSCNMWIAPASDKEYVDDAVTFWRDVYGFDMRAMQEGIFDEARVLHWPGNTICGRPAGLRNLDLYTVTPEDLSFDVPWRCVLDQDKIKDGLDGFVLWFDTFFAPTRKDNETVTAESVAADWKKQDLEGRVAFSTGPLVQETHWKQTFLMCNPRGAEVDRKGDEQEKKDVREKGEESVLAGRIKFAPPSDMPRGLVLEVKWGQEGKEGGERVQSWDMR